MKDTLTPSVGASPIRLSAVIVGVVALVWFGTATAQQCPGDLNSDSRVTVDELVTAVNSALTGCPDPGPRFLDNGDGTVTDNNTGLMWEKKDYSGGIHDVDNLYTWGMTSEPYTMNGTIVTTFLSTLNTPPCFAGHCDWRIPNVNELQSIVDYEIPSPGPTVNSAFHNAAGCTGCTDVTLASCSCTASDYYWSSTTDATLRLNAWYVHFGIGFVNFDAKSYDYRVRAVRGGL